MPDGQRPRERSIVSATIRSLLFVFFIGPGPVIGLVPYLMSGWTIREPLAGSHLVRWFGVLLFAVGLPLLGESVARFVRQGRGTPAPWNPTQRLVVSGPYQYVRNPMYIGVVSMIAGQGLFFGSVPILLYAAAAWLGFHSFVVFYEEPHLRGAYGREYESYRQQVPRWIPRCGHRT